MAPPPEYDKEPKAPDKNVTSLSSDDSKVGFNLVKQAEDVTVTNVTTTALTIAAEVS